jgi:hypothetical protein
VFAGRSNWMCIVPIEVWRIDHSPDFRYSCWLLWALEK